MAEQSIQYDAIPQQSSRKPAARWALATYLMAIAFGAEYWFIPAEQFHGALAGLFLLTLGLGFACGGICLYAIFGGRNHA